LQIFLRRFVWLQVEEDKKCLEEELKEKKNEVALQLTSGMEQRPRDVCNSA